MVGTTSSKIFLGLYFCVYYSRVIKNVGRSFLMKFRKFYPQILSTEDSFYIYERPLTKINVIASFCALNLRIKF